LGIFTGQLQRGFDPPQKVNVQVDDGRLRIWNDRRRLGAWDIPDVKTERATVFRFLLTIDGEVMVFAPDDPAGFSEAVGAVIDLRGTRSRFGLAERLRQAT
jgi:hypothetical protein